jgi:HK97 gp10 family phage protein
MIARTGRTTMAGSDLDDYLQSLPNEIADEIDGAIRGQAARLSAAQRQALQQLEAAPADSGDLEASCRVEPGENPLEYIVTAGGEATTKEVRASSGVAFDYALAFEYGTSRQQAKPFFWPTYNAMRDDMQQQINDAIGKALE